MNLRLKKIRKSFNLSQGEFGKIVGLTQTSISDMENGNIPITKRTVLIICEKFNINEEWFTYGSGNMFKEDKDKAFQQFFDTYSKLNPPLQDFLKKCSKNLLDTQSKL